MGSKLKPVDHAPICDPACQRRIDPVWMPGRVPYRFWQDVRHRRDYLIWVARRIGLRRMSDFYRLKLSQTCRRNYGRGLLKHWGCSALTAVQDCFPQYDWKPWLFTVVPAGFWDAAANHRSYLEWLGQELGFRGPRDWLRIRYEDLARRRGAVLLERYGSLFALMREFLPHLNWEREDVHRPIAVQDVLAWADGYHARHGKWPTCQSGKVAETGHTWAAINRDLRLGLRGLPRGTTLARFLAEHRGMHAARRGGPTRSQLCEDQILAWADAYFAEHRKWPTAQSGPIPGTPESWGKLHDALRGGYRGLPRGGSLPQLLAEKRGKRHHLRLPPLTEREVLRWAKAHFKATDRWPKKNSGPIALSPAENWGAVNKALENGNRGLPGGSSLLKLLRKHGLQ